MNYSEALEYIHSINWTFCKPGLERIRELCERLGDPQKSLKFIHVAGTNGKGSFCSMLESVLRESGYKKASGERIIARVLGGESCAIITDAGMPAISDPGEDIVRLAADAGVRVSVIPGACAAVSALSLSALATGRFCFEGFLSPNKKEREERLGKLKSEERTMIIYEAPHKLKNTLSDLAETFGKERKIALCRELTKLNEEVVRTTLGKANEYYTENEPRGEYVLILEGAAEAGVAVESENPLLSLSPEEHVAHYENEGLKRMDAIKAAAKDRGMSKSDLYKILNT